MLSPYPVHHGAAMLHDASQDNNDDIQLRYRTDGGVFNLRRLKANTNVKVATLRELLFAEYCALNSSTEAEMQHYSRACDNFGFTISTKNTEVMHQPGPRKMYHEPHIFVNDEPLKAADYLTYLGSTLSREVNLDVGLNNILSKPSTAFGRLRRKVCDRRGISQDAKLNVYMAVVLTVLLYAYACQSWTVYGRQARKLNHFHKTIFANYLEHLPDTEVLTRAVIRSIPTLLQKAHVRRAGHGCLMTACQNSPYMVSSAMANYHLVGKRNAPRTPLRRPSQALTSMSPTGKPVPRIDPCGVILLIHEQEQLKQTGSQRLRKACCSQSETSLYRQPLDRPGIHLPRVWMGATGPNWTE